MQAREIKALIHRSRAVDIIGALCSAGFRGVSLIDTPSHPMVLGFLGLNYDSRRPITTLLGQTVYGAILGAFLPA